MSGRLRPPAQAPTFATSFAPGGGCVVQRKKVFAVGAKIEHAYLGSGPIQQEGSCAELTRPDEAVYDVAEVPPAQLAEAVLSFP